jgi:Tfp pilus assembly protein PilZ
LSQNRVAKRHRWRLPCELVFDGVAQRAIVLDLSTSGVFVQTGARLRPGTDVEIRLQLATAAEPLLLRARVARAKQVPSQLTTVAHGGIGLRLREAPKAYFEAIEALESGKSLRGHVPESAVPGEAKKPAAPARPRFRVRVQQSDGPRSRTIELAADNEAQARAFALRECGSGWEAVKADRLG